MCSCRQFSTVQFRCAEWVRSRWTAIEGYRRSITESRCVCVGVCMPAGVYVCSVVSLCMCVTVTTYPIVLSLYLNRFRYHWTQNERAPSHNYVTPTRSRSARGNFCVRIHAGALTFLCCVFVCAWSLTTWIFVFQLLIECSQSVCFVFCNSYTNCSSTLRSSTTNNNYSGSSCNNNVHCRTSSFSGKYSHRSGSISDSIFIRSNKCTRSTSYNTIDCSCTSNETSWTPR